MDKCRRRRFKSALPVCISCAFLETVEGENSVAEIRSDTRVALCVAAARADENRLRHLLRGEIDLNEREPFFDAPPLFYAVDAAIHRKPKSHDVVELLAMRGADWDGEVRDLEAYSYDLTPLRLAIMGEEPALIRMLVRLGADVEKGRSEGRDTPLFFTLRRGIVFCVLDPFDNWLSASYFRDTIGPQAEALIQCGARTAALVDGGQDFRQLLRCMLVHGAADIAWYQQLSTESESIAGSCMVDQGVRRGRGNDMGPLLSIYQWVEDAVRRRREADVFEACNNAHRRNNGRWLLPPELVRQVVTFLGVMLLPRR